MKLLQLVIICTWLSRIWNDEKKSPDMADKLIEMPLQIYIPYRERKLVENNSTLKEKNWKIIPYLNSITCKREK